MRGFDVGPEVYCLYTWAAAALVRLDVAQWQGVADP